MHFPALSLGVEQEGARLTLPTCGLMLANCRVFYAVSVTVPAALLEVDPVWLKLLLHLRLSLSRFTPTSMARRALCATYVFLFFASSFLFLALYSHSRQTHDFR